MNRGAIANGWASIRYESELSFKKPGTDVVVNGRAWAPHGKQVKTTDVEIRVGDRKLPILIIGPPGWRESREPVTIVLLDRLELGRISRAAADQERLVRLDRLGPQPVDQLGQLFGDQHLTALRPDRRPGRGLLPARRQHHRVLHRDRRHRHRLRASTG